MLPPESAGVTTDAVAVNAAVTVAVESARTEAATFLLRSAEAELRARYPDYDPPVFAPHAVEMPGAAFFVARVGGRAVGGLALRPLGGEWDGKAELKRMWVSPDARGQGVAKALLRFAEVWARDFGYLGLMLETGIGQPEAIALYGRVGYEPIPCWGDYAEDEVSVCFRKDFPFPAPRP